MNERAPTRRKEALFSILARRVVGPGFLFIGLILCAYGVWRLVTTGTVLVDGQPTDDWVFIAVTILLPAIMAVFGILLRRADPYYFDE